MPVPSSTASPSSAISAFLAGVALAPRQTHDLLAIWPLVARGGKAPALEYVALRDAMWRGLLVVDELETGAAVPQVEVENRGEVAVLVLFGEEIHGAMQNRVANASFLIPPHARVVIDVSCAEAGRWSRAQGATFVAPGELLSHSIRRRMASQVAASSRAGRGFHSDQDDVWEEIAGRVAYSRTGSASGAYADYAATRRGELAGAAKAFAPIASQVGFVASIDGEIVGMEGIGRPDVLASAFTGLLRAYLIDGVDAALLRTREPGAAKPRFGAPEAFLAALVQAASESRPSLGLGADVRFAGGGVQGCALVAPELIHMTAFPAPVATA